MTMTRVLWIDLRSLPQLPELSAVAARWNGVRVIDRAENVVAGVRAFRPHVACIEFDYPDAARLRVLSALRLRFPKLPIVMFTEFHSEALAVWAFRSGVCDYRVKPVADETLARCLRAVAGPATRTGCRSLPPDLIETAGHVRRPPWAARKTGAAVAYIAGHYHENIRREALAKLCHLSVSEFSRVFRDECGLTFARYLLEYRVAMARERLADPGIGVTQVAYAVGFNDPSYFCRAFRRLVGVTPGAYSQQAQPAGCSGQSAAAAFEKLSRNGRRMHAVRGGLVEP